MMMMVVLMVVLKMLMQMMTMMIFCVWQVTPGRPCQRHLEPPVSHVIPGRACHMLSWRVPKGAEGKAKQRKEKERKAKQTKAR